MKFVCTQENLLRGLGKVAPIAGRNAQLPILEHVLLQLREGVLHCTATDLELGVHTSIPGKVEKEGSGTVIARKFIEYIQQLPNKNPITLEQKGTRLRVTTVGFQAQFPLGGDDDFPLLPELPSGKTISLAAEALCEALTRTVYTAARDQTRPEIHSVYIQGTTDTVTVAATDSFRLAEAVIQLPSSGVDFDFILPLATAQEIIRLFSEHGSVDLIPRDNHILLTSNGLELSSRLVDGKYPDYRQIIPRQHTSSVTAERAEFIRALKTLAVFLPRESRRVQLVVEPKNSRIIMTVGGSDVGEGTVELECTGTGEPLDMLFNIQYLLEGMQHIPGDEVTMRLKSSNDPALFMPAAGDIAYTYVVMPIQAQ